MIETDVLIVGAGPAGLATALALLRGAKEGKKPRVVVLDKGRSPGSHVLSGAIVDPSGLRPPHGGGAGDDALRGEGLQGEFPL